jgi:hypothetical protein
MPLHVRAVRGGVVGWSVAAVIVTSTIVGASAQSGPESQGKPARVSRLPCRLIAASTFDRVIAQGWERSETIRGQCEELARARAVVVLVWAAMDSQSQAKTGMAIHNGVVVATVKLPPVGDTIVLMAHELQHVIERTRGLDLEAEAKRPGSGVWKTFGGYETQAAVDVSRQVAKELGERWAPQRRPDQLRPELQR